MTDRMNSINTTAATAGTAGAQYEKNPPREEIGGGSKVSSLNALDSKPLQAGAATSKNPADETIRDAEEQREIAFSAPDCDYVTRLDGVMRRMIIKGRDGKEDRTEEQRICGYLEVIGAFHGEEKDGRTEEFGYEIKARRRNGEFFTCRVSNTDLYGGWKDGAALTQLINQGWQPLNGSTKIKGYILDYLSICADRFSGKEKTITDRLGWRETEAGWIYVSSSKNFTGGKPDTSGIIYSGQEKHLLSTKGTLIGWQQSISRLAQHSSRAVLGICGILTAPILAHLPQNTNMGFYFVGQSSNGKSSTLHFAQSVYGYQRELPSFGSTMTNFEAMMRNRNDMAVILDEVGSVRDKKNLSRIFYQFGNGTGDGRSNIKRQETERIRANMVLLGTGEKSLKQFAAETFGAEKIATGVEVRFLHIPAVVNETNGIFESIPKEYENSRLLVEHLKAECAKNYGCCFEEWINALIRLLDKGGKDDLLRSISRLRERFVSQHTGKKDQMHIKRAAGYFGLLAAVGELASGSDEGLITRHLQDEAAETFTGWPEGTAWAALGKCFDEWREDYGRAAQEDEEFIAKLFSFCVVNEGCFVPYDQPNNHFFHLPPKHYGYRKKDGIHPLYLFKKEYFRAHVLDGRPYKPTMKMLRTRGVLKTNVKGYLFRANPAYEEKDGYFYGILVFSDESEEQPPEAPQHQYAAEDEEPFDPPF